MKLLATRIGFSRNEESNILEVDLVAFLDMIWVCRHVVEGLRESL